MTTRRNLLSAAALYALSATGALAHGDKDPGKASKAIKKEQKDWGIAGETKNAKRTIAVSMLDSMRFSPDKIETRLGETIKFTLKNTGKVMHEFVIGTQKENDEHAALMLKFPNMEHSEPYMAHVPPGKTGTIVWTFNKPGDFEFACLIAGHYQAGMRGKIKVTP
jgi:uncharacterized cupredoxin-like copper-binding protein